MIHYMPDLIVEDISPRVLPVQSQVVVRVEARNMLVNNSYWCETSDGHKVKAEVKRTYIAKHHITRVFAYCEIKA